MIVISKSTDQLWTDLVLSFATSGAASGKIRQMSLSKLQEQFSNKEC